MNLDEVEDAFGKDLLEIPGRPSIIWPGGNLDVPRPRLIFQHNPFAVEDDTLDCTYIYWTGNFTLTALTTGSNRVNEARYIYELLKDRYPKGRRIAINAQNTMLINKPPAPRTGFPDGADWRLPIVIDYLTEKKT